MRRKGKSRSQLLLEIEDLKLRLEAAEGTIRAIRQGEADAVICTLPRSEVISTLKEAEHPSGDEFQGRAAAIQ